MDYKDLLAQLKNDMKKKSIWLQLSKTIDGRKVKVKDVEFMKEMFPDGKFAKKHKGKTYFFRPLTVEDIDYIKKVIKEHEFNAIIEHMSLMNGIYIEDNNKMFKWLDVKEIS